MTGLIFAAAVLGKIRKKRIHPFKISGLNKLPSVTHCAHQPRVFELT